MVLSFLGLMPGTAAVVAQTDVPHTPLELLKPLIANEDEAALHSECYEYFSLERSERTGGRMWTERIIENADGRVTLLLAIDGKELTAEQARQERDRLVAVAGNPAEFVRKGQVQRSEERHARHMLGLLPRDFLFDNVRLQDGVWRLDFHPNPDVSPSAIEDQVLHGMSGSLAIDARQMRLLHIEGRLPKPVMIGMGLLANIHAGSHFSNDRQLVEGHWRTVRVVTEIGGKAALFKSVAKDSDITRSQFRYLDHNLSVAEAVQLLLQQQGSLPARD